MKTILLLITIIGTVFISNAQAPAAPTYTGTTTICTGQNTTIRLKVKQVQYLAGGTPKQVEP